MGAVAYSSVMQIGLQTLSSILLGWVSAWKGWVVPQADTAT
ncbi:hypothetical protein HaLaN_26897, partial [Haematococcus lacustris]